MNDVVPPKQPMQTPPPEALPPIVDPPEEQPKLQSTAKRSWRKRVAVCSIGLLIAILIACVSAYVWYQGQLGPVDPNDTTDVRVEIEPGMTPELIAARLYENKLVKSQAGFGWYVRLTGQSGSLQAGSYTLNQSMSLAEIVTHLQSGKTETFRVTFLPGATVEQNKKVLLDAGYSSSEVDEAFSKQYDHPVFETKPASADLEGYIYGETYEFTSDATVEDVLIRAFDELQTVISNNKLATHYKKHGLSLYEGITLASIVQREVATHGDQKKVAGVFYNRLDEGMNLGSDVTYQYIADKTDRERDPNLDDPYNTRRYGGLPPGPIAAPGKEALVAVAHPTASKYLYFLSGDDDKTYFATTEAGHQQNIEQHCKEKCKII
jgi:UPF0755 protein